MTPQELKNSILQWAVQGKLVPQDPNDEPAKVLLEKIKAEKAELIKQKKLKAGTPSTIFRGEDNLFYETVGTTTTCIQDEIPFDIPDSWEWVRLGNICIINPRNTSDDNFDAGFMPMPLLKEGYSNYHQFTIKKWKEIKRGYTHFANNDIIVAKITPCFQNRKSAIITDLPNNIGAGTTELHVIRTLHETVILKYILWFVKTVYFIDNGVKAFTGTAGQQRVGADYISNALFPLPPLVEQKRIVEKIESIMPIIDKYGTAYTTLQSLEKSFPENLKKSLLQWAVQGKLVPQDPSDEPAKILLEKIKAEKAELAPKEPAGQKKIKADKNTSTIFRGDDSLFYETIGKTTTCIQDEIPFDIPDTWEWVRLEQLVDMYTGNSINEQEKKKNFTGIQTGRPYIATKDVLFNNSIDYKNGVAIPHSYTNFRIAPQNSVLLCIEGGSAGRKIALTNQEVCFGNKLCCFVCDKIEMKFLFFFLQSPKFTSVFFDNVLGIIGGVSINKLKKMLFPLPPLAEQKRIIEKLQSLMPLCAELENKEK